MTILWAKHCSFVALALLPIVLAQLNQPPKISVPDKPQTRYVDNGRVTLECKADGMPKPMYKWKLNGEDITSTEINVNKDNGTLTIPSFTEREEGNYQCIAENEIVNGIIAVAMSSVITLRKVELGSSWITDSKVATRNEGDYFSVTCDDQPVCVPPPQYSWYLAEGESTEGQLQESDRIYVDDKGTLHFIYLKKEDENGDLRYKCAIYNSVRAVIKLGSEKDIKIIGSTGSIPQTQAKNMYATNPASFLRTKNAQLECVFAGNPIPTIEWFDKQNSPIKSGGRYDIPDPSGRKLIIKNLVGSDAGMYRCKGTNSVGSSEANIFLNVISGPIWEESLSSQVVPEGRDAVFNCKAHSIMDVEQLDAPQWFKNGVKMNVASTAKYEFSDNSRVLTVKNLDKSTDIQCFQCNVSNNVGYEFASGCLNIVEPITITVQPELKQEITKGDIVNLTVIGTTDPALTLQYRWLFKNVSYENNSPPHVTFNATTMHAYINTSALTQEQYKSVNGTYYRILYHNYENRTVPISITLTELPVVAPVAAAAVDLWWIALIVALIILIIVIILIVVICNRKRQEGTYPLDKKERANDIDPEKDLADSGFHDLSRAPGDDDYPTKKTPGINPNFDYGDDMDMGEDDESLMEYGGADYDTTKFNEDGSFIGQYTSKNKVPDVKNSPQPLNHHSTESQI